MSTIKRDHLNVTVGEPPIGWKSDVVAKLLRNLGFKYVLLNPGASYRGLHDSIVNYLGNENPQMVLCLNEDHVVSIAHGYAKATDEPLACVLHSNVGLMHGMMGLFNAWADRVPMFVLGATGPVAPEKRRPWIDWIHTTKDQGAMLRNFIKWDDEPRSVPGIIEGMLRGFQMTTSLPRAPVYVCLDAGLQEEAVDGPVVIPDIARFGPASPPAAAPDDVAAIAALIEGAVSPVFLIGRGSRRQDDWDRRVALAERTGAAVLTSLRERAVFPTEHPQHVGTPSGWVTAGARKALNEADLLVSFDWIDLNGYLQQINRRTSALPAKIVHISLESVLHNGWSMDHFGLAPADMFLTADADTVVRQLLDSLQSRASSPRTPWFTNSPSKPVGYGANGQSELVPHDIEVALTALRAEYDFTLAHTTIGWASTDFHFRGPLDYLGHDGGAGLAAGPGLTIGAALALQGSGRIVVGVLGDGDFLQGVMALWTAAHYGIAALFIVSNNRSNFNDEIHQETVANARKRPVENRWVGQRIDDPAVDLAAMARAQGVEAIGPVATVPDLVAAIRDGLAVVKAGRPFLIDARVKPGYANIILSRHDD